MTSGYSFSSIWGNVCGGNHGFSILSFTSDFCVILRLFINNLKILYIYRPVLHSHRLIFFDAVFCILTMILLSSNGNTSEFVTIHNCRDVGQIPIIWDFSTVCLKLEVTIKTGLLELWHF